MINSLTIHISLKTMKTMKQNREIKAGARIDYLVERGIANA